MGPIALLGPTAWTRRSRQPAVRSSNPGSGGEDAGGSLSSSAKCRPASAGCSEKPEARQFDQHHRRSRSGRVRWGNPADVFCCMARMGLCFRAREARCPAFRRFARWVSAPAKGTSEVFAMVDALFSPQRQHEVRAAVMARRRLIIPLVAALVLIGGGWMTVWAFGGSKAVARPPRFPPHQRPAGGLRTSFSRRRRGLR